MNWHTIHPQGIDIAIVGATGLVGQLLLEVLAERNFPVRRLKLLASARSANAQAHFQGTTLSVGPIDANAFDNAELVFFAATGSLSQELAPRAVESGAIVVDKSSSFRLHPEVPLVIPEINPAALDQQQGIIASPNCTTTGLCMALEPLRRLAGLREVVVTTFQAVSGAGRDAMQELACQTSALANGGMPEAVVLPRVIADNVLAACDSVAELGYTHEEHKLRNETRKVLSLPELRLAASAVRVPVSVGHSASVLVETERALDVAQAQQAYAEFEGTSYVDSPEGPTPRDVANSDEVLIGRLRRDFDSQRLWLWEVSNNLRKGAATNAVQIAEHLVSRGHLSLHGD